MNLEPSLEFAFEELQDTFYDLMKDFKKISMKKKDLKTKNEMLIKEKEETLENYNILKGENKILKKEVDRVKSLVEKFIYNFEKL